MWRLFETFTVSVAGGYLFSLMHIPLPWLLGPLTAVLFWHQSFQREVRWPLGLRNTGLVILGFVMGSSFTAETVGQILRQLPALMMVTVAVILFSLLLAYFMCKGTGISLASSIIGNIPGGLSQMVVLSEEISEADATVVTFLQTIRLLTVVFVVPFIVVHGLPGTAPGGVSIGGNNGFHGWAGWSPGILLLFTGVVLVSAWAALRLNFPTPFIIGPLTGSAILVLSGFTPPPLPGYVIIAAQLFVGAYMGATFRPAGLGNWKKIMPYSLVSSLCMVLFSLIMGYLINYIYPIDLLDAFLCTAPGGMAEIGLTAVMVKAELSLITAYQMFRVLVILFIVPSLLKYCLGYYYKVVTRRNT